MRITVFGASGKVGRLLVENALKDGFFVVAFCHGSNAPKEKSRLLTMQGNIYNKEAVDEALKDSDVVLSALGSWGTPRKDILTLGMKNIIPSMRRHKIKRIISLTGADAYAEGDNYNISSRLTHLFVGLIAKKVLQDGERHIQLLNSSGLDWTIIRSTIMNEKGEPQKYELSSHKQMPWSTVNRSSVALCMIEQIMDERYIRQSPYIKRIHK